MPLIPCPDCAKEISDLAPACPNCGRPSTSRKVVAIENEKKRALANRYNLVSWVLAFLAVLALLVGAWELATLIFSIALILSIIYLIKR